MARVFVPALAVLILFLPGCSADRGKTVTVTSKTFEEKVLQSKQPVFVAWGHTLINAAMGPELLIGKAPLRTTRGPIQAGAVGDGPMRIVGPPPLPV